MKKLFYILCFILVSPASWRGDGRVAAQPLTDTTNHYEFLSLEEALKNPPENVFKLTLRKSKLKEIPPEVFTFKNLRKLNLSKNKIESISHEIVQLENLEELDLSKNKIEYLPEEVTKLKKLITLKIGENDIGVLPSSIGQLESLENLDLWSNNITDLPDEIQLLRKLKTLDLRLIQMNPKKQQRIKELLPKTTIHFSNACDCD